MKNILITGISGFAGSHLAELLVSSGENKISGTFLFDQSLSNIQNIQDKLKLIKLDLTDSKKVEEAISELKPEVIFHLAAIAATGNSFENPTNVINNNIGAQVNILEAVKKNNLESRIIVISSAEVYGLVEEDKLPIDENTPLNPLNPYAVSKIAQDYLGLQYFNAYKMDVVRIRPFNHIGPRQSPDFVASSFAKYIAEIEKGQKEPVMKVGNLEAKRDFTDVKDMMKAYILASQTGKSGDVYNIGTGISYKISDILNILLSYSSTKIEVESDKSKFRPNDIPESVCDHTKFTELTGWKPEVKIEDSLKDILDYWRNII